MDSIYPSTRNVHFDHFISKDSNVSVIHCKVTPFPLAVNKYFVRTYFETMAVPYSSLRFSFVYYIRINSWLPILLNGL